VVQSDCSVDLTAKLQIAEQLNKSLQTMSFVYLGLGIGLGGIIGIIFMQVLGFLNQGRVTK
jgi:hypothetical protein